MADTKLSNLSSATPALGDLVYIVDVSDTTDDPAGSSRKTTLQSALDTLGVPYSKGGASITENSDGSISIVAASGKTNTLDGILALIGATTPGAVNQARLYFGSAGTYRIDSGADFLGMLFYSNAIKSLVLDTSGNWLAGADNAYNIGDAGATGRPAVIYVGTAVDLGSTAWIRNHSGKKRLSANATNATATLSSGVLSDLTITLIAGRKYTGRCVLIANNSTGAEGLQYDFNGGTATMTNFQATAEEAPIGATLGTTNSTALGTALTNTVVSTSDTVYAVNITLVCNAGGTFIPRFAENSAHVSGTATIKLGSYLWLEDTP